MPRMEVGDAEVHDPRGSRRFRCGKCGYLHEWGPPTGKGVKRKRLCEADRVIVCGCGRRHYR
jgi:hypothetical protein